MIIYIIKLKAKQKSKSKKRPHETMKSSYLITWIGSYYLQFTRTLVTIVLQKSNKFSTYLYSQGNRKVSYCALRIWYIKYLKIPIWYENIYLMINLRFSLFGQYLRIQINSSTVKASILVLSTEVFKLSRAKSHAPSMHYECEK